MVVAIEEQRPQPKKKKTKPSAVPLPPAVEPPPPLREPSPPGPEPGTPGGGGEGEGGGGSAPGTPPVDGDLAPGGPGGGGGDAPDPDLVVAPAEPSEDVPARRRKKRHKDDLPGWEPAIGGGHIAFDLYTTPAGKQYPNWKFLCNNPMHANCVKTKGSTEGNSKRHGLIEALAFLHAWRDVPITDPTKTHNGHPPTDEAVDAFVLAHKEELEEIAHRRMEEARNHIKSLRFVFEVFVLCT